MFCINLGSLRNTKMTSIFSKYWPNGVPKCKNYLPNDFQAPPKRPKGPPKPTQDVFGDFLSSLGTPQGHQNCLKIEKKTLQNHDEKLSSPKFDFSSIFINFCTPKLAPNPQFVRYADLVKIIDFAW